ncbi:MAG: MFS transporter [Anaerolineales bacterium]|nr:MFS transporter [Anaerolineales bacterium]
MEKERKRAQWGWYLYDFGNSAYAAVVLLAIYSAYFKGSVVGGAEGSRLWGIAVGIAMLVSAVISPLLAVIADYSAFKKRFLLFFSSLSWLFTALLFFVRKGDIFTGMLFFVLAEIGYRAGQVFYNSLLTEVANPNEIGKVSANGWAIGSVGGIICLLLVLPAIVLVKGSDLPVRGAFVFTAIFFLISALPTFLWVKETGERKPLPEGMNYFTLAFSRLGRTVRSVRHFSEFLKFIIAFLIFNDGIVMALDFAAIIGAVLYGMNQTQLIILMIVVQVASVAGAYLSGIIGERTGLMRALYASLLLMLGAVIWMFFNNTLTGFFVIASVAGLALTGVQAVTRTMAGIFAPKGQSAEFYSFFAIAGRTSSFIGPTIYGLLASGIALRLEAQGMDNLLAEQAGQRAGILSIAVFLVVGMLILLTVSDQRARQAAVEYAPAD